MVYLVQQTVKETIGVGVNEKAVLRLFINCPFVCINFELYVIRSVADILNADKHSPASGMRSTKRRMGCLCPFYLIGSVEDDKSSKSRKYRS